MKRFLMIVVVSMTACSQPDDAALVGELASDRIDLTAEFREQVVAVEVTEGQLVERGQVLVQLDDRRARARQSELAALAAQHQARLAELTRGPRRERIDQARASLSAAEQDLAFRNSELTRIRGIAERGLASADSLDRAETSRQTAAATVDMRHAALEELLAGTTLEELRQAEQALAQVEARLAAASVDVEKHTLRSPVDGVADSRLIEVGETAEPGRPLFTILGGEKPYARVFVPMSSRTAFLPGSEAVIRVAGIRQPLTGRVRWVSSDAAFTPYFALTEHDRDHLSFLAKVDIVDDLERLPDGVPVTVELASAGVRD